MLCVWQCAKHFIDNSFNLPSNTLRYCYSLSGFYFQKSEPIVGQNFEVRDEYFSGKCDQRSTFLKINLQETEADISGWVPDYSHDVLRSARPKHGMEIAACGPEGIT